MATGIPKTNWGGNGTLLPMREFPQTSLDVVLTYEGKKSEDEILETNPAVLKCLWPTSSELPAQENKLCYGENYKILASLLVDDQVRGKVKLIYIDPPFATKSIFQSRTQNDAYSDLLTGAHYIEFLRERLILLRELLADDGSIYVHLDGNMAFQIKIIMDEVFGPSNFRNWITRKKCNTKNYTRKVYGNVSDYILFYTKSDNYIWKRPYKKWTSQSAKKEYQYVEEASGRRYKKVPIHAPGVRNGKTGMQWRGMNPPPGKHWQYPPEKLEEMDARGEIYWSPNGNPRRKIFLDESLGIPIQDIWNDFLDAYNQNVRITGYPTEKNPDLLSLIIEASSNKDDLVLDCFSGSGTTLATASILERKWIGIDSSPEAIATTLLRFDKGLQKMGDYVGRAKSIQRKEEQEALPLFTVEESKEQHKTNASEKITNFDLFSQEEVAQDIQQIVDSWKKARM